MPPFSFVHTADLHLDSPFSALSQNTPEVAGVLREAAFQAFEMVIQLCLEKKVDFLVVAGDIYDGADRNLRAQVKFRDGLARLHQAGISSYVVHGNHDPLEGWSSTLDWPPSVHIFGDQVETADARRGESLLARIQGVSYPRREERRNLSQLFGRKDDVFHIGLLHANVGQETGHEPYAPCSLEDLLRSGMDYWALGHVHRAKILSEHFPTVAYPGNTQGRNIRETGGKGCYFARVTEDGRVVMEFHLTEAVRWVLQDLPIGGLRTDQDLLDALERICADLSEGASGKPVMARIRLTGRGPLYRSLRNPGMIPDLLQILSERVLSGSASVWVEQLRLDVFPDWDMEALAESNDFLGELHRTFLEISCEEGLDDVLREDLNVLFEDPRARRFLERPCPDRLKALLAQAEGLCLEGIVGEGSAE